MMTTQFIEFIDTNAAGTPVLVAVDQIALVAPSSDDVDTNVVLKSGEVVTTTDGYDSVRQQLKLAGALVHREVD